MPLGVVAAVDPQSNGQVEGVFGLLNGSLATNATAVVPERPSPAMTDSQTADTTVNQGNRLSVFGSAFSSLPVDPDAASQVDGALSLVDLSGLANSKSNQVSVNRISGGGEAARIPVDPTRDSSVEGVVMTNAGTRPVPVTAVLVPMDPTKPTEIDGTVGTPVASVAVPTGAAPIPVDPTSAKEIEGAMNTVPVIQPAAPGSLKPTDPAMTEGAVEGMVVRKSAPATVPASTASPVTGTRAATVAVTAMVGLAGVKKQQQQQLLNGTTIRIAGAAGASSMLVDPVDPSVNGNDMVEGEIGWPHPVRKVAGE